ncbi:SpoIIE family protein phosphatase [Dactylosporangium aurantiacum]|uniref:protein-serine/threonine phosphatase n=1 Tax=Dactylosporangium aurantiacum TaxID=35754 RepID=A0A9Q9IKB4_9ACTN|nr:SpoIIE family protein phosphatase [Dactylosporangium aurantiacum]MDG6109426.1 SpoIIE family protein phosphatase [Dactylosporangium aurantiacum]UWZ55447.1 SpoIIE family protein phosphatase [Dactylosporangium aurantiacum]
MYDLNSLSLSEIVRCGTEVRAAAGAGKDLPGALRAVATLLRDRVRDGHDGPGFAWVRVAAGDETVTVGDLPAPLPPALDAPPPGVRLYDADDYPVRVVLAVAGAGHRLLAGVTVRLDGPTAQLFELVGLNLRIGLQPHQGATPTQREEAFGDLLTAVERAAAEQAGRMEQTIAELGDAAGRLRRSRQELREREARLRDETSLVEALHAVGTDLSSELDIDRVVQRATDVATELTGAAFGSFFYNVTDDLGESYLLYTLSGVSKESFAKFPMPRNTKVFDPTFRGVGYLRSDDITKDPRYGHNLPYAGIPEGHLPVVSYLAVPVVSSTGEVLGGFFFGHPRPARFTARHERLAVGVAAHAAVALDNARLYLRQRNAAVELQRSLLPRIPRVEGLEVVSRYLPAAKGVEVGGDWVDLVPLSAGRVALVVGDVMGKGIRAAAVMGQLRTAIRSYASLDLSPGQLMRQLNTLLAADLDTQMATCVYAVYDLVNGELCYTNAGHPPAVGVLAGQSPRLLTGPVGPPLGIVDFPYTEQSVAVPPGEALLLYTDGLVERRDSNIEDRLDDLQRRIALHPRPSLEAIDDLVAGMVDPAHHEDDIAVLYVRQPPGEVPLTAVAAYPASPEQSRAARRFVQETLGGWGVPGERIETAVAAVAELFANAATHARTHRVELRLHLLPAHVAVEVCDQDNRLPFLIEPAFDDEHHRGLHIVRATSDRWGTRPVRDGKIVWAEIPLRPAP